MTTYNIEVTIQAQNHLKIIRDYIAITFKSPSAAESLLDKMGETFRSLSDFPTRNKLIDIQPWNKVGIRKIIIDSYYAYYWIDEKKSVVYIIAVISEKRDQATALNNL